MNTTKSTAIILYPRFSEYELSVLLSVLHQGGKSVKYVGLDRNVIKGEAGLPCIPETTIQELNLDEIDSIMLPGVDDFQHLINHHELSNFLNKANDGKRIIGAISSAPYLLSISGVLENKKYTVGLTEDQRNFLGTFNEKNYMNQPVVVDGNVITGKGSSFINFAFQYGELLNLKFDKRWYNQ